MDGMMYPQHNQLQFNLNPMPVPSAVPIRFHPPQPIIIEKFDAGNFILSTPSSPLHPHPSFSFISQDSMSDAVRAAQCDRKQMNEVSQRSPLKTLQKNAVRNQTKIIKSSEYVRRLERRNQRGVQPTAIREHSIQQPLKNVVTQTYQQRVSQPDRLILPVRSMSPPTRDTTPARDLTHDEKMLLEISRLRAEITKCLQQIKQIEMQRELQKDGRMVNDEDVTERARRTTRAEEQAIRSARNIYALNRQVTQFQDELGHTNLKSLDNNKKSQLISRLATLHRSIVRTLQVYVRHMSDADVCQNVGAGCRDLAAVIRRLSVCCAQLEVASDAAQPDDLLALLNDVVELTKIAEPDVIENMPKSVVHNKQLAKMDNRSILGRDACQTRTSAQDHRGSNVEASNLPDHRRSELRSRIRSLLEAGKLSTVTTQQTCYPPVSQLVGGRPQLKTRGVLIKRRPQKTFKRSEGLTQPCSTHYAKPTVATSFREQLTRDETVSRGRSRDSSPANENIPNGYFAPRTSPARHSQRECERSLSHSPGRVSCHELDGSEHSFSGSYEDRVRYCRAHSPTVQCITAGPSVTRSMCPSCIRSRDSSPSRRTSPWQECVDVDGLSYLDPSFEQTKRQADADALSNILIDELVKDAASELYRRQLDNVAERRSAFVRDAPSVSTLLQRLQEMEMEQDAIRQRWTTVVYDGRSSNRSQNDNITAEGTRSDPGAILFTKREQGRNLEQQERNALRIFRREDSSFEPTMNKSSFTRLRLARDTVDSIERNVSKYEEFLHSRSHNIDTRFNPWKAVECIADDILETCIKDIATELDQINSDVVDHVYNSEFSFV